VIGVTGIGGASVPDERPVWWRPPTVVVPFDFLRLPVMAVVGMGLYAEALDAFVFIGAAVIFAANLPQHLRSESRRPRSNVT
jgi:hypothetical protein